MSDWKVTTVILPKEIDNYDALARFMQTRFTLHTEFFGEALVLTPGTIKPLGRKLIGGIADDGLGDMFLVKIDPQFIGPRSHDRRKGTKDSWTMYTLPLKFMRDGVWNEAIDSTIKTKLRGVLNFIYIHGECLASVNTTSGRFGSGNRYCGRTDGSHEHVQVLPAENQVTIPDHTAYGMPANTFTSSNYDRKPYYSFVKNAPVVKDMDEPTKGSLLAVYAYLCNFENHRSPDAYALGQWLKLLHQGGFKYMVHKNYSGGVHVVEELAYCVMKIGAKPHYRADQLPIKSGAAEHLPACVLGLSDFEDVSIKELRDTGVHFGMYSALKPGRAYIFSRREPNGIHHYWSSPALVAGGFIYRPKSGVDCLNYGCRVYPFGTSIQVQKSQGAERGEEIMNRCVNCFTENCATIGFVCRNHNHYFLCGEPECVATKARFATGRPREGSTARLPRMFVCPVCRLEHTAFSDAILPED